MEIDKEYGINKEREREIGAEKNSTQNTLKKRKRKV